MQTPEGGLQAPLARHVMLIARTAAVNSCLQSATHVLPTAVLPQENGTAVGTEGTRSNEQPAGQASAWQRADCQSVVDVALAGLTAVHASKFQPVTCETAQFSHGPKQL